MARQKEYPKNHSILEVLAPDSPPAGWAPLQGCDGRLVEDRAVSVLVALG
jgi:hypothetical protein